MFVLISYSSNGTLIQMQSSSQIQNGSFLFDSWDLEFASFDNMVDDVITLKCSFSL